MSTAIRMTSSRDEILGYVRERLAAGATTEAVAAEIAAVTMKRLHVAAELVTMATDATALAAAEREATIDRERRASREAKRIADVAELRRVSTPYGRKITADDPSVHGSHLLGHEGERFPR